MKYSVKVKPGARKSEVLLIAENLITVAVHAIPEKGKANKELIQLLSEYFKVPKSRVVILKGETGRNKIVEIIDLE